MAFSLHERAFYALMVMSVPDQRRITALLEAIDADPLGNTDAIHFGPGGRREHIRRDGGLLVHDILAA